MQVLLTNCEMKSSEVKLYNGLLLTIFLLVFLVHATHLKMLLIDGTPNFRLGAMINR